MFQLDVYSDLRSIEPFWRDFEDRAVVLLSQWFDWVSVWFDLCGDDLNTQPCPVVVNDGGGEPLMLLPLGIQSTAGGRNLVWMGGQFAEQNAPLIAPGKRPLEPDEFGRLWKQIKRGVPRFDRAVLVRQPKMVFGEENPFASACTEVHATSSSTKNGTGWEAYYGSKFSSGRRGDSRRRLGEIGDVEFRILDPTD